MLSDSELKSLVVLLDDDDPEVVGLIEQKIMSIGTAMIPVLENEWTLISDIQHQQKVENIIHKIHFQSLKIELKHWIDSEKQDLFEGCFLIARYKFPALNSDEIKQAIEKLKMDAWLEMHYDLSPYEKVKILNYVFYQIHGFRGNTAAYHDPKNSFINQVLESKQGSPILLAVIYMLIAQKLNLPVFGVNLPQHFVLAYMDSVVSGNLDALYNHPGVNESYKKGNVLFYINAFNQGAIFSKANLDQFLKQINIEPNPEFFKPCSNLEILKRILRNLSASYEKMNKLQSKNEIQELLLLLGEPPINSFTDLSSEFGDD